MPLAAIGAGIGAAGSAASGIGGKKAQNQANKISQQQLGLQQQQFGLSKQQVGLGDQSLSGAGNYWSSLLQGGQAARQAVGPIAGQLGQAAEGARQSILATTPRGGEQNLAVAQNYNQLAGNVANLYAGLQPLAAQNLGQLGGEYLGSGASLNPQANVGAALGNYANQQNLAAQGGAGFGGLLYNSLNKQNSGNSGGGGLGGKQIANQAAIGGG